MAEGAEEVLTEWRESFFEHAFGLRARLARQSAEVAVGSATEALECIGTKTFEVLKQQTGEANVKA